MTVNKMDTTSNTYVLFLDMMEIEQLDLVKQVVNKAKKHPGNPILVNGNVEDWDASRAANWASSMAYDDKEKLFKIWYYGTDDGSAVATEDYDGNIGCFETTAITSDQVLKYNNIKLLQRGSLKKNYVNFINNPVGCLKNIKLENIINILKKYI